MIGKIVGLAGWGIGSDPNADRRKDDYTSTPHSLGPRLCRRRVTVYARGPGQSLPCGDAESGSRRSAAA